MKDTISYNPEGSVTTAEQAYKSARIAYIGYRIDLKSVTPIRLDLCLSPVYGTGVKRDLSILRNNYLLAAARYSLAMLEENPVSYDVDDLRTAVRYYDIVVRMLNSRPLSESWESDGYHAPADVRLAAAIEIGRELRDIPRGISLVMDAVDDGDVRNNRRGM